MTSNAVSTPGKLFVLGEYAVLAGGPALLTTTARHVYARDSGGKGYQLLGPSFSNPDELPEIVAATLTDAGIPVEVGDICLDLREFYHDDIKLGLGSSAASTVALVGYLAPFLSPIRRFEIAFAAHRAFQGGRGSGADIAASTFGATIAFYPAGGTGSAGAQIRTKYAEIETGLVIPEDLQIKAVWTGKPARSTSFIDGIDQAKTSNADALSSLYSEIASTAKNGIEALQSKDSARFIEAIRRGDELMEALGELSDLPIITDTHRKLRSLAKEAGFVAKPSGAGGGDFTLLIGPAELPLPDSIEAEYLVISAMR